jgi:hypothetical protein
MKTIIFIFCLIIYYPAYMNAQTKESSAPDGLKDFFERYKLNIKALGMPSEKSDYDFYKKDLLNNCFSSDKTPVVNNFVNKIDTSRNIQAKDYVNQLTEMFTDGYTFDLDLEKLQANELAKNKFLVKIPHIFRGKTAEGKFLRVKDTLVLTTKMEKKEGGQTYSITNVSCIPQYMPLPDEALSIGAVNEQQEKLEKLLNSIAGDAGKESLKKSRTGLDAMLADSALFYYQGDTMLVSLDVGLFINKIKRVPYAKIEIQKMDISYIYNFHTGVDGNKYADKITLMKANVDDKSGKWFESRSEDILRISDDSYNTDLLYKYECNNIYVRLEK